MHIFNFKNLDVPDEWMYRYYLQADNLPPLDGRRIRIYSPFNQERTPSMFLYVKGGKYLWYDHSAGRGGDALRLVFELINESSPEPVSFQGVLRIVNHDYKEWLKTHRKFVPHKLESEHFVYDSIVQCATTPFTDMDLKYWGEYGIGLDLLKAYNVKALQSFRIGRRREGEILWMPTHKFAFSYGFFCRDSGKLIKIYNPLTTDYKHITFMTTPLGMDNISDGLRTLIICSSMKDMLALKGSGICVNVIAPPSESTVIPAKIINELKERHRNVYTLFDNDKAGIKAMAMYKALYDLDFIYVPFEKDLADFRKSVSPEIFLRELCVRINNIISKDIDEYQFTAPSRSIQPSSSWQPHPTHSNIFDEEVEEERPEEKNYEEWEPEYTPKLVLDPRAAEAAARAQEFIEYTQVKSEGA